MKSIIQDKKNIAGSKKNVSPHKILSLSNWMPWQNRLQDTRLSGHSLRSQHLVNIMEFMDIQSKRATDQVCIVLQSVV